MIEIPTLQLCRYCGGHMNVGLTEDALPLCGPSIRIGVVCKSCGQFSSAQTFQHAIPDLPEAIKQEKE